MQMSESKLAYFRQRLMYWYNADQRPLPWKGENNPYLVWLSEIILQQTRAEQGAPYFERFRRAYPTVQDLAAAPEDEVMKHWAGLGYYARARNLHAAARLICERWDGAFPDTYEAILSLPGVGSYTAAAIASFAFNLPHAVVDGNVFRVLARFLGIATPIDSPEGQRLFRNIAQQALDYAQPARYNQAIMDFGATVCTPQSPNCSACPLSTECAAFYQKQIDQLPAKAKKLTRRKRYFHYLVVEHAGLVLLQKRRHKDIWQHLYEFPLIELQALAIDQQTLIATDQWRAFLGESRYEIRRISQPFQQTLTHQVIQAVFIEIECLEDSLFTITDYTAAERKNLSNFAFPKIIDWYLRDNSLFLNLL